jgi:hypothetical protein
MREGIVPGIFELRHRGHDGGGWNDTRPTARALVLEWTFNRCQVRALI